MVLGNQDLKEASIEASFLEEFTRIVMNFKKFKRLPSTPTQELTQEQFDAEMAFAPRKYFFPTIDAFKANMMKRIEMLKSLEKRDGWDVSKEFREDFLSRND